MVTKLKDIKNWNFLLFIAVYHILLIALLPLVIGQLTWGAVALFVLTFIVGGLSITAGYHRLFSHRAYSAHPVYEWAVLLGSTMAFQWTALSWSHDHRLHHKYVDTDKDPYSIKKGFWYAHMLWMLSYQQQFQEKLVPDLLKNPRVMFQHRHYLALAVGTNLAVFGIGCLFMHPLASFYFGVVLRIFALHHCTWFINSLAHTIGSKTYAKELSAVDNALLAFVTFGEGYHNYHHAFQADYRNGIRWYHFDPTKWLVWTASKFGITRNLKVYEKVRLQKALVMKDKELILEHIANEVDEMAEELRQKLEDLSTAFENGAAALMKKLTDLKAATAESRRQLRAEIRHQQEELRRLWKEWVSLTTQAARRYQLEH